MRTHHADLFTYIGNLADQILSAYVDDSDKKNGNNFAVTPALVERVVSMSLLFEKRTDRYQRTFERDGAHEETKMEHLRSLGKEMRWSEVVIEKLLEAYGSRLCGRMQRRREWVRKYLEREVMKFNEDLILTTGAANESSESKRELIKKRLGEGVSSVFSVLLKNCYEQVHTFYATDVPLEQKDRVTEALRENLTIKLGLGDVVNLLK